MKDYFKGDWSEANLRLLAGYDAWTKNEPPNMGDLDRHELEQYIQQSANIGDTHAIKLYEDDRKLVYLSVDSSIDVLTAIDKKDFGLSKSIELD